MSKKVTMADMKRAVSDVPAISADTFNKTKGQKIAGGGNVLTIKQNTGAGPFVVAQVLEKQQLDKRYDPVTVYVLAAPDGTEYRSPAATSFRDKAQAGKLSEGDTLLVFRNADYKARGKMCESYAINITKRA